MSIPGPPENLEWITFVLVGENWPRGDEDGMRALAEVWRRLGEDLSPLEGQLRSVVAQLEGAGQGPALEAARAFLLRISGGADSVLPKLRKSIDDVAQGAEKVALEIEYTKLMIIGFAAILLHMLMKLIFLSVMSGGAASAAAAPIVETFRQLALRLLKRLALAVVQGALFMVALDVAVQAFQVVVLKTRDLNEWDLKKTGFMAGIGALGGAIGWSLGWMRMLPLGKSWLGTVVKNSLSEGLPELIADLIAQGDPDMGARGGFVGGLASGAVEGAIQHRSKALSRHGIFTENSLLFLLAKMFGADVTLGPPPDVLQDLPKGTGPHGTGAGSSGSGTPDLSAEAVADADPVPAYFEELPVGEVSLATGQDTNTNTGQDPGSDVASGRDEPVAKGLPTAVGSSGVAGSGGQGPLGGPGDGITARSWGVWGPGPVEGGGGSPLSGSGEREFADLLGADGGPARERFFDEWRGTELGWFEGLLDSSLPEGGDVLGLPAEQLRSEWLRQVETQFVDVFGSLVSPVDPLTGVSLVPTSVDQVRALQERWRGFVDDVRLVADLGAGAWTGALFTQVFTDHAVDVVVDRWLETHPDVTVSLVDRVALRQAAVAEVRGEVLARLAAVAENGAVPANSVVQVVRSVRDDGAATLERRVDQGLAALVAAGAGTSPQTSVNISVDAAADATVDSAVVVPPVAVVPVAPDGSPPAGPGSVRSATVAAGSATPEVRAVGAESGRQREATVNTRQVALAGRSADPALATEVAPAAGTVTAHLAEEEGARQPAKAGAGPAWAGWNTSAEGGPASGGSGPAASDGTPVVVSDSDGRAVYGWVPDGRTAPAEALLEAVEWVMSRPGDAVPATVE
ncbi:hypothetical protein ABT346_04005, partial [Micromonospora peucetia]|uniref:WXG100-like domain-containing protein n=1 Tax=Micromonospora peucetia TaxID=47871 RepID=UPI00332F1B5F